MEAIWGNFPLCLEFQKTQLSDSLTHLSPWVQPGHLISAARMEAISPNCSHLRRPGTPSYINRHRDIQPPQSASFGYALAMETKRFYYVSYVSSVVVSCQSAEKVFHS